MDLMRHEVVTLGGLIYLRMNDRLSQKTKKLEYQKSLLTLDVGW